MNQKTDDALTLARRAYHVELGPREKAVSLSAISLSIALSVSFYGINIFRVDEYVFENTIFMFFALNSYLVILHETGVHQCQKVDLVKSVAKTLGQTAQSY